MLILAATVRDVQSLNDPAEVLAYLDAYIARTRPDHELAFVVGACAARLAVLADAALVAEIRRLTVAVRATAAGGWPELRDPLERAQRVADEHGRPLA